jgi:hypothetical protein
MYMEIAALHRYPTTRLIIHYIFQESTKHLEVAFSAEGSRQVGTMTETLYGHIISSQLKLTESEFLKAQIIQKAIWSCIGIRYLVRLLFLAPFCLHRFQEIVL